MSGPEELHPFNTEQMARLIAEFKMAFGNPPSEIMLTAEDFSRFEKYCERASAGSFNMAQAQLRGIRICSDRVVPDGFLLLDGVPYKWEEVK